MSGMASWVTSWWTPRNTSTGEGSCSAYARSAIRSWPIVAAAWSPWPVTSPMASPMSPPGSCTTSYQSPPTCTSAVAGT